MEEVNKILEEGNMNIMVDEAIIMDQVKEGYRIRLVMDVHDSVNNIDAKDVDTYLKDSVKLSFNPEIGQMSVHTNTAKTFIPDIPEGEKSPIMYVYSMADVVAIDEFCRMSQDELSATAITSDSDIETIRHKLVFNAKKRYRKFLREEEKANMDANRNNSGYRTQESMLVNLDAGYGVGAIINHIEHGELEDGEVYYVLLYNNVNKYNTVLWSLVKHEGGAPTVLVSAKKNVMDEAEKELNETKDLDPVERLKELGKEAMAMIIPPTAE